MKFAQRLKLFPFVHPSLWRCKREKCHLWLWKLQFFSRHNFCIHCIPGQTQTASTINHIHIGHTGPWLSVCLSPGRPSSEILYSFVKKLEFDKEKKQALWMYSISKRFFKILNNLLKVLRLWEFVLSFIEFLKVYLLITFPVVTHIFM